MHHSISSLDSDSGLLIAANTEDSDEVECSQGNDSPMTLVPEPILGEPDPGAAPLQQKPGTLVCSLSLRGRREDEEDSEKRMS